jgi:SAM-dependent methyltransferase
LRERWIFDMPHAKQFVDARKDLLDEILPELKSQASLHTALDVGCGVGIFSGYLHEQGFKVVSFDGRPENVAEASTRFPGIEFHTANVEASEVQQFGSFDLVICLGLLYHLENPFRAIRNLHALTGKVLLIESMCVPERRPILLFSDEWQGEDQGLNFVAFYPSEACLTKMLHRSGFPFVYRVLRLPAHQDFQASFLRKRARTMLAASKVPLNVSFLSPVQEPVTMSDPWRSAWAGFPIESLSHSIARIRHLMRKLGPRK